MTFERLIELFPNFKEIRIRENTYYGYKNKLPYLKLLYNIKVKDFSYIQFEKCHDYINFKKLVTRTKNDIYNLIKTIMNYGDSWYKFNFTKVCLKMTNFNNPNEMPKEQLFFTYNEFNSLYLLKKI